MSAETSGKANMSLSRFRHHLNTLAFAGAAACATLLGSTRAHAQAAERDTGAVSPTGKGIVGGGLLGAEVVCITMAAIGVNRGWPYFVFGGVGAAGGAVGGFFVEKSGKDNGSAEPSLYMLAGGMALVIPTLVVSLNATAYRPPATDSREPVRSEPAAEPPRPETTKNETNRPRSRAARTARREAPPPLSLVGVNQGALSFGAPAPEVRPLYSSSEMWKFGVPQGQEVRFPVLRTTF
jgi:hypothetical protein